MVRLTEITGIKEKVLLTPHGAAPGGSSRREKRETGAIAWKEQGRQGAQVWEWLV
jgi:hypothetical protein